MTYRRALPKDPNLTWTYWVSRDSTNGELSGKCSLWRARPLRVKHRYRVAWVGASTLDPGHLGDFRLDEIYAWFRVHPETDRELIRIEWGVTERMLKDAEAR